MRVRRRSRSQKWLERIGEVPWWQRAAALAVPAAGAAAIAGRRRVWQGIALLASGVERVADTVEDGAESLRDAARVRGGLGQAGT